VIDLDAIPDAEETRPVPDRESRARFGRRSRHGVFRLVWWLVMLSFVFFFAVPILWLVLAPTKSEHDLIFWSSLRFGSFSLIRESWDKIWHFQGGALKSWFENSLIYCGGGVAIALVTSILAGYGLAITQFIGRKVLLAVTLIVMLVPSTALVLPLFLEINFVHLIDTPWSLILPFGFFPFGTYLTYIFFSSTIPKDLLNAARIDGCSEWNVFRRVALPLARPIVALVAFFAFVSDWNNFFLPFVMLPDSTKYPLPVGLQDLLSSTPAFNPTNGGGQLAIFLPELAMAILVAVIPVLIVFLFSQRALMTGMLAGATKE
jgi:multiple sugar transport system permease protein